MTKRSQRTEYSKSQILNPKEKLRTLTLALITFYFTGEPVLYLSSPKDLTQLTYHAQGLYFRLTDVHGNVVKKILA